MTEQLKSFLKDDSRGGMSATPLVFNKQIDVHAFTATFRWKTSVYLLLFPKETAEKRFETTRNDMMGEEVSFALI